MKNCPNCQRRVEEEAVFCPECGLKFMENTYNSAPNADSNSHAVPPYTNHGYSTYPPFDPYDHTAEFDAKDISENKVIAMLIYLAGVIGIFIALLSQSTSKYVAFHLRQALKFFVIESLTVLVMAILAWTFIVPIVGGVFLAVLWVIKIVCFFQICSGKAIEPAIIRSFGFLR